MENGSCLEFGCRDPSLGPKTTARRSTVRSILCMAERRTWKVGSRCMVLIIVSSHVMGLPNDPTGRSFWNLGKSDHIVQSFVNIDQ